jgi:hypothetical protein
MGFSVDENGFLIPNAHEEAILEEIRILHRQGYHPAGIARELLKSGMLSRKGKPIDKALIGHWLKKRLKTQQSVTADAPPSRSEAIKKGLLAKQRTEGWKPGNPRLGEAGKRGTATLKARCAARDQSIEPVITRIIETTGVTSYNGIAAALDAIPQPTVGGAKRWYPTSLRNIMRRLGIFSPHHPGKPRSVPDGEPSATFGPKPPAAPPLNTPLRRYSSMRRDHVVALYHEGVEPREIAVRLKFRNIKTVYRILHEANKPVGRTRAKTKEAEIVEQHAAGRPISEISEKTGIHPRSVYRLLAKRRQQNEAGEANTASFADQTLAVIWNLQGAGYLGDGTLAKQLNERGMPYKNGTQWTRDRVKRLLATGKSQEPDDLEQRKFVGFTIGLLPVINELHAAHCTAPQQIARALNFRHLRAFDGCPWQAAMVTAFLDRINWQPPEAKALPMTPPPPLQDDTDQANDEPVNLWAACQWAAEHVLPIVRELQALGFKTSAAIRYQIDQRGIRLPNGLPLTPDDVKRLVASTGASL